MVEVRESALGSVAAVAALDLARLRELDSAVVRDLPDLRVDLRIARRYLQRATAPNLIAVLEGRDPRRRHEYVAISAHLDHVGVRTGRPDSIFNGADDNASGVAGLLELAEAFSRREARPARSLLFLVPSGEEKGLWGSAHWVRHPTVQLGDVVADLNMDLIGRNWVDSVIVTGPEMSTLGETLRRVTARHPELRMAPVADRWPEERIFYRSDHYNLALAGVPVLFFTSGTHADYHQPSDVLERIDTEKASRLVRLRLPPHRRGGERARAATVESGQPRPTLGGTMKFRIEVALALGVPRASRGGAGARAGAGRLRRRRQHHRPGRGAPGRHPGGRLDDGARHAEPRPRDDGEVRGRRVPPLRSQARSRQRHLVPALSDHAPPAAAGAVARGAQGGRDQRDRQARRDGAPRQRRHSQTAGGRPRDSGRRPGHPGRGRGDEAARQGRALRPRLLDDDPHERHPGRPRAPAERSARHHRDLESGFGGLLRAGAEVRGRSATASSSAPARRRRSR